MYGMEDMHDSVVPRRRRRFSSEFYEKLLTEQETGGQSVAEFALARGLSAATLYLWRRKLGRATERAGRDRLPASGSSLLAVDIVGGSQLRQDSRLSGFEVELGRDLRVLVPRGFDQEELLRLLTVLRAC